MISFLGFEYVSGGFPSNALTSKILPMSLPGNVDNVYQWEFKIESRQREPKKTEIKREIIAYEIALSRRRELKEEVKRKMTSQKASRIQINDKIRGNVTSWRSFHVF